MDNQNYSEDSIDLKSYIRTILKRKRIIIGVFLVCLIGSALFNRPQTKIYETRTLIRVGNVSHPLLSDVEILHMARENPAVGQFKGDISAIKVDSGAAKDLIVLKVQSFNPDTALTVGNALTDFILAEGNDIYDERFALLKEHTETLEKKRIVIEEEIEKLSEEIHTSARKSRIPSLRNTLFSYEAISKNLATETYALKLEAFNTRKFEVFEAAELPTSPINPYSKKIILIWAVLGLMLGVFAAFFSASFSEVIDDNKNKRG